MEHKYLLISITMWLLAGIVLVNGMNPSNPIPPTSIISVEIRKVADAIHFAGCATISGSLFIGGILFYLFHKR